MLDESKYGGSEGSQLNLSKTEFSKTSPFNLKRRNRWGDDGSVREIGAQCDLDANTASMSMNKGCESTEIDKELSKRSKSIAGGQEGVRHVEFLLSATPTTKIKQIMF